MIYAIYDSFIQYNILYIIPLLLYSIILYCLITDEDSYLFNLVRKLVLNFLFILYGISYINLLIAVPIYFYIIIQSFVI
jgi:hypothetical protein